MKINVQLVVLTKNENFVCHGLFQRYVQYFSDVCYKAHNLYCIAVFVPETSFKWDLEQICLPLNVVLIQIFYKTSVSNDQDINNQNNWYQQ